MGQTLLLAQGIEQRAKQSKNSLPFWNLHVSVGRH